LAYGTDEGAAHGTARVEAPKPEAGPLEAPAPPRERTPQKESPKHRTKGGRI